MSSLLIVGHHHVGGGVYGDIVSQSLLPASMLVFFSFIQCGGVSQLVWGFFYPEEVIPYTAVDSVYLLEEVS